MTKTQLVNAVAGEMPGISKAQVKEFLEALMVAAEKTLQRDKQFVFPGVVKVMVVDVPPRAERKARNPATGVSMVVPAKAASKRLKAKFLKPVKLAVGQFVPKLPKVGAKASAKPAKSIAETIRAKKPA